MHWSFTGIASSRTVTLPSASVPRPPRPTLTGNRPFSTSTKMSTLRPVTRLKEPLRWRYTSLLLNHGITMIFSRMTEMSETWTSCCLLRMSRMTAFPLASLWLTACTKKPKIRYLKCARLAREPNNWHFPHLKAASFSRQDFDVYLQSYYHPHPTCQARKFNQTRKINSIWWQTAFSHLFNSFSSGFIYNDIYDII